MDDQPPADSTQLNEHQVGLILSALTERGVKQPCPRCGNEKFTLHPHLHVMPLQKNVLNLTLGGPALPAAITFCNQCGWVAEHALGVLGLLNDEFGMGGDRGDRADAG